MMWSRIGRKCAKVEPHRRYSTMAKDAEGMRGFRSRNQDGQLRDKRDDTHMGTIEKQYDRDFGVRSDMELGTFLRENNIASLNDLIQSELGRK